jgi:hypothetical protein
VSTSIDRVAEQLAALKARLDRVSRSPQLANSSIENANLKVKNAGGATTLIVGQQYDGTAVAATVNGPNPPVPSAPTLAAYPGGTRVTWDGSFVDPQAGFTSPVVAPMDLHRVDVHEGTTSTFTPSLSTKRGEIAGIGGALAIASSQTANTSTRFYRLVATTLAGKVSAASTAASTSVELAATINTVNSGDSSLQSQINTLNGSISSLQSQINSLQSQLNSLTSSVNSHVHRADAIYSNGLAGDKGWTANVQAEMEYGWAHRNDP